MATPTPTAYAAANGAKVRGGRPAPDPAWLATAGAALNKIVAIPGLVGGGGAVMVAWGSIAVRQSTGEIFTLCQSGHFDGAYNGVTKANLLADSPAWVTCSPGGDPTPFAQVIPDSANYNADGKPVATHSYDFVQHDPITDRIYRLGGFGTYPNGNGCQSSDSFDPVTNTWSAHGAHPYIDGIGYGNCIDPTRGNIWTSGLSYFNTTANAFQPFNITGSYISPRFPQVYDRLRDQIFSLLWGDGGFNGQSNVLAAAKFPAVGGVRTVVTFNASAAYTEFQNEAMTSAYAGMTYDRYNDCFYWYGTSLFVVRPNNTNTWTIERFPFANGSAILDPVPSSGAGINGRIKMIDALKGFAINPSGSGQWYFVQTSN